MALSERERKILDEIERQFKKEGPEITDEISDYASVPNTEKRIQRWEKEA